MKAKAILFTLLLLAAGITAAGQGTYGIDLDYSPSDKTLLVTITRTGETSLQETVYYRTVNGSALEGVHFTNRAGSFVFQPGDTEKQFTVPEEDVDNIAAPYCLYAVTSREYRIEVTDIGGAVLASGTRTLEYGESYQFKHRYANQLLTDFIYMNGSSPQSHSGVACIDLPYTPPANEVETSGTLKGYVLIDDSYDYSQKAASVSTDALFEGAVPRTRDYLAAIGTKMYATVCFTAKEKYDGYAYIQVLAGDKNASYDTGYDPDESVNDPVKSIYKACFELNSGSSVSSEEYHFFFPHYYDYRNRYAGIYSGGYQANHSEFGSDDNILYTQKFKSGYFAPDAASFLLDPTVTDLTVRFDCGGKDDDTFGYKDLFVIAALQDAQAPQLVDIKVAPGNYAPGFPFYFSLVFDELIVVNSHDNIQFFDTSWGGAHYISGYGTNVLTYGGEIAYNTPADTPFEIEGLNSNTTYLELGIKDMIGNSFSEPISRTFNDKVSIADNVLYSISYVLNGGALPQNYNTSYRYSQRTTLPIPVREGKIFLGWFDNAQLTGTAYYSWPNQMRGNITLYAKWDDDFASGHAGTEEDPYLLDSPHALDLFAANVNNGNDYKNKYIKLAGDITYSHGKDDDENNFTSIDRVFRGVFDGGGYTIRGIRLYAPSASSIGLFGTLEEEGVIKNLKLADARIRGDGLVGGFAGQNRGSIVNCSVAGDVYITANEYGGGIAGDSRGPISGCLSRAQLQRPGTKSSFGGIVGRNYGGSVENCLAVNAAIPMSTQSGAIAGVNQNGGNLIHNYYRNCTLGNSVNTGFGCEGNDTDGARCARLVTSESGITATVAAPATGYSVSGITVYGSTSLRYGGNLYSLAGLDLALNLSHNPAPHGYIFSGYKVSAGSLSGNDTDGYVLAMPDADVTITGYEVDLSQYWGTDSDGTEAHPYIIRDVAGWNLLAQEVAEGRSFSGNYFCLGDDLGPVSTTVGTEGTPFGGIFNGGGHTLTINLTEDGIQYYAPFHYINGATLRNLRVDGSLHSNRANAGGIVGYITGGTVTIEDCVSSVTITSAATGSYGRNGGLAGYVKAGSTAAFTRCVFDGQLLKDGTYGGSYHGGMLGEIENTETQYGVSFTNCLVVPSKFDLNMRSPLAGGSASYVTTTDCYYATDPAGNTFDYSQHCQRARRATLSEALSAVRGSGTALAGGAGSLYADGASWAGMEYYTSGSTVMLGPALGYVVSAVSYNDGSGHAATDNGDGTWSFTMPNADVTLSASFTSEASVQVSAHQATLAGQAHYWATFYHPSWNYSLPAGAQAFILKPDKALYRVGDGGIIPAGCAVVIMADAESVTLTVTGAAAPSVSDNILQGVSADTAKASLATGSQQVHVLGQSGETFGFFEFSGTTVPANKAYYVE